MNLLTFDAIDAQIKDVFGPGMSEVRAVAQLIDRARLREITPTSWITCPVQREDKKRERA